MAPGRETSHVAIRAEAINGLAKKLEMGNWEYGIALQDLSPTPVGADAAPAIQQPLRPALLARVLCMVGSF